MSAKIKPTLESADEAYDPASENSFRRELETFLLRLSAALEAVETGKSTAFSLSSKRENLLETRVGISTFNDSGVSHG